MTEWRRLELAKVENERLHERVLNLRTALHNANNRIGDLEWELSCLRDERDALTDELHDLRQEHT